VSGVNPPMESKNGPVARWLAGGKETTELTLVGRWIQRRGGVFSIGVSSFSRTRKREGVDPVPHIGNSRPTARQSGQTEKHARAPIFGQ
jgi:hypothetical protein